MEGLQDLEIKGESTNLLQGTNTTYGTIQSPFSKRTPMRDDERIDLSGLQDRLNQNLQDMPKKQTNWQKFKSTMSEAAGSKIGTTVGTAVAEGLVNLGMSAISRRKKEPKRKTNVAEGFSQVQIGKKRG
jgi:hypothetical protein